MVGLLDVGKLKRTVPVQGVDIEVNGVSAAGLVTLMSDFPEVKKALTAGGGTFKLDELVAMAPNAVASIIALATAASGGTFEDRKAIADGLALGDQAALLEAAIEITMPQGIGPFVEAVTRLLGKLTGTGTGIKGPASK